MVRAGRESCWEVKLTAFRRFLELVDQGFIGHMVYYYTITYDPHLKSISAHAHRTSEILPIL